MGTANPAHGPGETGVKRTMLWETRPKSRRAKPRGIFLPRAGTRPATDRARARALTFPVGCDRMRGDKIEEKAMKETSGAC